MKMIRLLFVCMIMYSFVMNTNEVYAQSNAKADSSKVDEKPIGVEAKEINISGFKNPESIFDTAEIIELSAEQKALLDEFVTYLNDHPNAILNITGNSDNLGTSQQQMDRSVDRANVVMQYLLSKGIAKDKIFARGRGALMPIADNHTEEGRMKNRRVTIKIETIK